MVQIGTKASTGLPELDDLVHGLWIGDNVVFQVDKLQDYQKFVTPFSEWALKSGRRLVYFHFAKHLPLLPRDVPSDWHEVDPSAGFENFIGSIHESIQRAGRGAFYVFDCLSELAADWFSDEMLGNFFRLTCPYLYDMETVAYFSLIRNYHSHHATSPIRETTQILFDIYHHNECVYVRPVKAQMRHSHSLSILHAWKDSKFEEVSDSRTISEILNSSRRTPLEVAIGAMDIWERTFLNAEQLRQKATDGVLTDEADQAGFRQLLRMIISRDPRILDMAERYLSIHDILDIARRTIGSGLIGGKTVGMLLATAILKDHSPRWEALLEQHDSYYVASDVFFSYLVRNGCWWARQEQRDNLSFLRGAQEARRRIITGSFDPATKAHFAEMLDYYGKSPIIVRSSSLLEDAFGNSFAGKYDSVFCANQGSWQQRLDDFMSAVKTVYASSIGEDALAYRARHGLLNLDEQMALLVQRVSGRQHGQFFYPQFAGVGFSLNLYAWSDEIDPEAGLVRLVYGLGTRAVDRMDDDCTRLVALNAPMRLPDSGEDGIPVNTQRNVDVIDLHLNQLATKSLEEILEFAGDPDIDYFASVSAREAREARRQPGRAGKAAQRLTFKRLLAKTEYAENMREMLKVLADAYECPVDVEFTGNIREDGSFGINVVQCRPLQMLMSPDFEDMPKDIPEERKLLETAGPVIGRGRSAAIDRIIYVDPAAYAGLPLREKYSVARLIGRLVHAHEGEDVPSILLLGPGRWGTTTPTLGVTVTFAEIEHVSFLCEIVDMGEHPVPEVSLGTHFFSEMVEMDMLYMVLHPGQDRSFLNRALLAGTGNRMAELVPESAELAHAVYVVDARDLGADVSIVLHANTVGQEALCYTDGAVTPRESVKNADA